MDLYGAEHVERYIDTDGREGFEWRNGTHILLLFTKGRKSGKQRIHPLIFREVGGRYVVVASKGGAPEAPEWYQNLETDPDAEIQVKGDRFDVRAHTADADEKSELWTLMTEVWPDYDDYQKKTDREIPIVVLERR